MSVQRLANGRLLVPERFDSYDGTLGDAAREVGPDDPDYATWLTEAPSFAAIALPERFVLEVPDENGGWIDHGAFRAADFDRLDDGTYVCAGHGGSPLFLRCLEQRGDELTVLDGANNVWACRLVGLPSHRYPPIS